MTTYTLEVKENEGEFFIELNDEILNQVGWVIGDVLTWTDNKDGSFTITKAGEKEMSPFEQVKTFMVACDQPVTRNEHGWKLYQNLIDEELAEMLTAYDEENELEELDGVCDLIWVLTGYALSRGWDIQGAFNEVNRSNMSKVDPVTGKAIKNEAGKVIKPATFSKPDLKGFLNV